MTNSKTGLTLGDMTLRPAVETNPPSTLQSGSNGKDERDSSLNSVRPVSQGVSRHDVREIRSHGHHVSVQVDSFRGRRPIRLSYKTVSLNERIYVESLRKERRHLIVGNGMRRFFGMCWCGYYHRRVYRSNGKEDYREKR